MITQYLGEKTLKGNRSIRFNLFFYALIQVSCLVLLSMNLAGSLNNRALIWILIPQMALIIGTLVFGLHVFTKFKEINHNSDSLSNLIQKQLWFYCRPYEIWLVLASLSAIVLIANLNLFIDNGQGSYAINNTGLFSAYLRLLWFLGF